jgi:pantothenate kinase type III
MNHYFQASITVLPLKSGNLSGYTLDKFDELMVVITGGDHQFLHNKLKINIFAVPDLVLLGLNEIFDYNDDAT